MYDVEVGEMTELLTSQEEDTVKHVSKLGQEEVVADGEGRHGFFITAVIDRLKFLSCLVKLYPFSDMIKNCNKKIKALPGSASYISLVLERA